MQEWPSPGKYLGLLGEWSKSKNTSLGWLKEKVIQKIGGWKESLLNQAGKEVLMKSVVQAIPSYAMAILRFPKKGSPEAFTGKTGTSSPQARNREAWALKTSIS
ncbi:hypothetical protein SESBI_16548 [Sesbania bispinosa]|nr:hypothetical protein SESBI_16548 [Sesbania bispinosa]